MGLGIITIVGGLTSIVLARPLARQIVRSQNRTWHFRFGDKTIRQTVWMCRVIGLLAVLLGISMIRDLA